MNLAWSAMPDSIKEVAAIAGALVVLAALINRLWIWLRARSTAVDEWAERRTRRRREDQEIDKVLRQIVAEFKPNGGSTIRDALNRIEQWLHRQEAERAADFMLDPEPLWKADGTGALIAVNRAFCELVGHDAGDLLNSNWKNYLHPEDARRVISTWQDTVRDGRDYAAHYRFVNRDGMTIGIETWGECCRMADGEPFCWKGRATAQAFREQPAAAPASARLIPATT
jgi:PAS domain S-box-containing protein